MDYYHNEEIIGQQRLRFGNEVDEEYRFYKA